MLHGSKDPEFQKGMLPPEDRLRVPLNFKLQLLPSQFKLFMERDQKARTGTTILAGLGS